MSKKIWVINMGSTSSKLAYFEDDKKVAEQSYEHAAAELIKLETVEERCAYRRPLIESFIKENNIDMTAVDAIAARGVGGGGSYKSGAYLITEEVRDECAAGNGHQGLLTSTVIGYELSQKYNIPAYLYDVVPVNEIEPIAEITGSPLFKRTGGGHTLNTRATARLVAKELGKPYDECTFVVCHMGGGISTNLQKNGRIIDIIGSSEGTFSPDRAGGVPEGPLRKLYKSGKYTEKEIGRMLNGQGGLIAYLGTNDCKEVERRIGEGDAQAELVYHAMAYQIAKGIGTLSVCVGGKLDAIILTGGIANSKMLTGWIKEYVGFIAPVIIKGGAIEIEALAGGVLRVLNGEEKVNSYEEVKASRGK